MALYDNHRFHISYNLSRLRRFAGIRQLCVCTSRIEGERRRGRRQGEEGSDGEGGGDS